LIPLVENHARLACVARKHNKNDWAGLLALSYFEGCVRIGRKMSILPAHGFQTFLKDDGGRACDGSMLQHYSRVFSLVLGSDQPSNAHEGANSPLPHFMALLGG
jgi:hypothetical protein